MRVVFAVILLGLIASILLFAYAQYVLSPVVLLISVLVATILAVRVN